MGCPENLIEIRQLLSYTTYMRLLCLLLVFLCACPRTQPPRDGGSVEYLGVPTYWEAAEFPLTIVISNEVSSETALATYIAAEVWNETVARDVFEVERRDFSQPAGRVCGFIAVSQRDIQAGTDPKPEEWDAFHSPYMIPNSARRCATMIVGPRTLLT